MTHELRREVDLTNPRCQRRLHVDHCRVGDSGRGAYTGEFVGRLHGLCGTDDRGGVDGCPAPKNPLGGSPHGAGELIDRHGRATRDEGGDRPREGLHSFVELQIHRAVDVIGGQFGFLRRALTKGQKQVRPLVIGEYQRDRALNVRQAGVTQRPAGARGVRYGVVAQEDQRTNIAVGHRRPQSHACLAAHSGTVRFVGDVDRGRVRCGTCSGSATSVWWNLASAPQRAATFSPPARSTSAMTTRAPSSRNLSTIARPIPDAPPVTIATFPAKSLPTSGSPSVAHLRRPRSPVATR